MSVRLDQVRIRIVVPGVPVPQGSKMPWGAEANPHLKAWRESIARAAADVIQTAALPGPVHVEALFVFPRPKAHFRTGRVAGQLKPAAPLWHTSNPGLDKLQRALGDAFKGTVIRDDAQVAAWTVRKLYGDRPCARLVITPLAEKPSSSGDRDPAASDGARLPEVRGSPGRQG
jgi:Holliday junction resolvase RusA-like endonuclease